MKEKNNWQVSPIISHRGASAIAPENTLAALRKAHELGGAWVEADVRLTLDGQPVMFHDSTLNRCTNGRGLLRKTPYGIIADLDAGSWFSPQYAGEQIPTLDQWLQTAAELGMGIILDLKANRLEARRLADLVSVSLSRYWRGDLPRPLLSSTSPSCLRALANTQQGWDLAYIMGDEPRSWKKLVKELQCIAVHVDHQSISDRWLQQIKELKLHVAAYTVNDPLRAQQLFDWGIESIFTDDPELLSHPAGY
jgi:glycerophosphoryl diester phosphodiesterase